MALANTATCARCDALLWWRCPGSRAGPVFSCNVRPTAHATRHVFDITGKCDKGKQLYMTMALWYFFSLCSKEHAVTLHKVPTKVNRTGTTAPREGLQEDVADQSHTTPGTTHPTTESQTAENCAGHWRNTYNYHHHDHNRHRLIVDISILRFSFVLCLLLTIGSSQIGPFRACCI